MQYTDESILQLFKRKDGGTNGYLCGWNILKNRDIDAYNYLKNRYNDIDDNDKVSEILYRIKIKLMYDLNVQYVVLHIICLKEQDIDFFVH